MIFNTIEVPNLFQIIIYSLQVTSTNFNAVLN